MEWTYNGLPVTDEMVEGHISFVYVITRTDTGKAYVGKKKLIRKVRKKPLKGKKRARLSTKESDWREYYGSNEDILNEIALVGTDVFKREIIRFCKTIGEASYFEAKEQFARDVILSDKYYNGWIAVKVRGAHMRHLYTTDK